MKNEKKLIFKEIDPSEAVDLIIQGKEDSVYFIQFGASESEISCVNNYRTTFSNIPKHRYFLKEFVSND